jgi:thymidine kinase
MAQDFAKAFYNSKEWRQCRAGYIASVFHLCENCGKPGYIVHHKKTLTPENINDHQITLSWSNLKYVCKDCHEEEHHNNGSTRPGLMFDEEGNLMAR